MPVWAVVVATAIVLADQDLEVDSIGWFLLQAAILGVGVLILANRPGNRIGRIIFTAGAAFAVGVALGLLVATSDESGQSQLLALASAFTAVLITLWVPLLAWALFLFPTGELPGPRWKWPGRAIQATLVLAVLAPLGNGGMFADPDPTDIPSPIQEIITPVDRYLAAALGIGILVSLMLAGVAVLYRFVKSQGVERQQMKWLGFAMLLLLLWTPISFLVSDGTAQEGLVAIVTIVLVGFVIFSMGIAIIRYRLYEIDRIISRTVAYALVVGVLAAAYLGVVAVLTIVLNTDSPVVVAGSTLMVAALFNPIRKRVLGWVDQRFNRTQYEIRRVLDAFATGLRDETDAGDIAQGLGEIVEETLQPRSVGVWIAK